jgi:acyl-CoA reductase-like NAD-dependent aldehyde dehydrogenase
MREYGLFIDGQFVESASGETFETHDPSNRPYSGTWTTRRRSPRRRSSARFYRSSGTKASTRRSGSATTRPTAWPPGVWSRNIPRALEVVNRLRAGTVWVNDFHLISPAAPFGGYKQSGVGREHGEWGLKNYLEVKTVHVNQVPTKDQKFWFQALSL